MTIKLYNDDFAAALDNLQDNSVDLVLCDPPYGATDAKWDKSLDLPKMWQAVNRVLKPDAYAVFFCYERFTVDLIQSNYDNYKYRFVWVKDQGSDFLNAKFKPMSKHEDIAVFNRTGITRAYYDPQRIPGGKPYYTVRHDHVASELYRRRFKKGISTSCSKDGSRLVTTVLNYPRVKGKDKIHSTQKPVDLLCLLIESYCPPGGTVLDFCMGSGSCGMAAVKCDRDFIGVEINPDTFSKAQNAIMTAMDNRE